MIPEEVVDQVAQQADIVAIISEHVRLKKVGSDWRGPCPFHNGKNANFSVRPGRGYTCFVCGEKGSVFTFVQKRLGMSFVEAVKYVGAKAGIEVKEEDRRREGPDPREPQWELQATVAEYFRNQLWEDAVGGEARDYLRARGIEREAAERFGLGFAPRDFNALRSHLHVLGYEDARLVAEGVLVVREGETEPRPRFRNRLIFPIMDPTGHTVGFGGRLLGPGEPKYLNSSDSAIFSKGRILYNLFDARGAIRRDERAILVEGYFDVVRLVEAGIESVVAPMGTALGEGQAELLSRYTRRVFLVYDSDAPGQKATFRAADILLSKGFEVRVVTMPEGEDPDTFVQKHGKDGIQQLLDGAIDVFDRKVQLLERGGWFGDLQRKRRALDRMLPTIRAASDPVTRELYLTRAAEASGVDRIVLLNELHSDNRRTGGARWGRGGAGAGGQRAASRSQQGSESGQRYAEYDPETGGTPAPYKSEFDTGNAEQTLIRVLLTVPGMFDEVIEEIGKLESEFSGDDGEEFDPAEEGDFLVLSDPVYRAIYIAMCELGPEADPEGLSELLNPVAVRVYEDLRGDREAVVDARRSIADAVRRIRFRHLDLLAEECKRMLVLADDTEKDQIMLEIMRLTNEKRRLDVPRWGAVSR